MSKSPRPSANERAINLVASSTEPAIRHLAVTEVLGNSPRANDVQAAKKQFFQGRKIRTLLADQQSDGGFGVHPYQKWTGAHWRLVSLVELGMPKGDRRAVKAADQVLKWLMSDGHRRGVVEIEGLTRRCASQEGNALAVCSRLGLEDDLRVRRLAESLVEWQWPDGGWNCDRRLGVAHSSFNESLATLWGLVEYAKATGDEETRRAAEKAAEFFLRHRIFLSCRTDEVRPPETFHSKVFRMVHPWTVVHYPAYWHYDILQALVILGRTGKLDDPRVKQAVDLLESKRSSDGCWHPEGFYWSLKRTNKAKVQPSNVEVVDWGRRGPSEMITLNALRVFGAAGKN